jgi:hypothetical protein
MEPAYNFHIMKVQDKLYVRAEDVYGFFEHLAKHNPWQADAFLSIRDNIKAALYDALREEGSSHAGG